jgi:hypothetical protein
MAVSEDRMDAVGETVAAVMFQLEYDLLVLVAPVAACWASQAASEAVPAASRVYSQALDLLRIARPVVARAVLAEMGVVTESAADDAAYSEQDTTGWLDTADKAAQSAYRAAMVKVDRILAEMAKWALRAALGAV